MRKRLPYKQEPMDIGCSMKQGHYSYHLNAQQDLMRLREVIVGPLSEAKEREVRALSGCSEVKIIKAGPVIGVQVFRIVIKQNGF